MATGGGKPDWIRIRFLDNEFTRSIGRMHSQSHLNSVCQSARCPNRMECWSQGIATFMVLGDACTRSCRFCSIKTSHMPPVPDPDEPRALSDAIGTLAKGTGLRYAVITSVTRDDLSDGGAGHIASCVERIKEDNPEIIIEALVPDFQGDEKAISRVIDSGVDVLSHNIETVERLTPSIRDKMAGYRRSLSVLSSFHRLSEGSVIPKSGLMVGFGESEFEIMSALKDLREADVEIVTIGQYLRPGRSSRNIEVKEFIRPEKFDEYKRLAYSLGFKHVECGPFVRSSYMAGSPFISGILKRRARKRSDGPDDSSG